MNVYWREFERGYVYVNPSPHASADFSLPEPCKRLSHGNINEDPGTLADVLKIDLGALRAAILVKTSALAAR